LITVERMRSVIEIAERVGKPVDVAKGDLKKLRDEGYFTAAGLDATVDGILRSE